MFKALLLISLIYNVRAYTAGEPVYLSFSDSSGIEFTVDTNTTYTVSSFSFDSADNTGYVEKGSPLVINFNKTDVYFTNGNRSTRCNAVNSCSVIIRANENWFYYTFFLETGLAMLTSPFSYTTKRKSELGFELVEEYEMEQCDVNNAFISDDQVCQKRFLFYNEGVYCQCPGTQPFSLVCLRQSETNVSHISCNNPVAFFSNEEVELSPVETTTPTIYNGNAVRVANGDTKNPSQVTTLPTSQTQHELLMSQLNQISLALNRVATRQVENLRKSSEHFLTTRSQLRTITPVWLQVLPVVLELLFFLLLASLLIVYGESLRSNIIDVKKKMIENCIYRQTQENDLNLNSGNLPEYSPRLEDETETITIPPQPAGPPLPARPLFFRRPEIISNTDNNTDNIDRSQISDQQEEEHQETVNI